MHGVNNVKHFQPVMFHQGHYQAVWCNTTGSFEGLTRDTMRTLHILTSMTVQLKECKHTAKNNMIKTMQSFYLNKILL
jgi:hypothetical protein